MLETITDFKMPVLIEDLGYLFPKENSTIKRRFGIYQCFCGNKFKTQFDCIKSGQSKSCGCYHKKHIKIKDKLRSHLYAVWVQMKHRTTNQKNLRFKNYGGRGIKVCDTWLKFENFYQDMGEGYKEGLSIDRIDVNGNYEILNCRWTTRIIQARNTTLIRTSNTSGYRGVCFYKSKNKWLSQIMVSNSRKFLGLFDTSIEAAKAYDTYVIENNLEHNVNGVI